MRLVPTEHEVFVFDLDGTLHVDFEPILSNIRLARSLPPSRCYFVSNSDRYSGKDVLPFLRQHGIDALPSHCATTLDILPRVLREHAYCKQRVSSPTATQGVHEALIRAGYSIVDETSGVPVILGNASNAGEVLDRLRYEQRLDLWVTNGDMRIRRRGGYVAGLGALLEAAGLAQSATVIGKPSLHFAEMLGIPAGGETAVIGDNQLVDGEFAKLLEATFYLVNDA